MSWFVYDEANDSVCLKKSCDVKGFITTYVNLYICIYNVSQSLYIYIYNIDLWHTKNATINNIKWKKNKSFNFKSNKTLPQLRKLKKQPHIFKWTHRPQMAGIMHFGQRDGPLWIFQRPQVYLADPIGQSNYIPGLVNIHKGNWKWP